MEINPLDLSGYKNKQYIFKTKFSKFDIAFFRYAHILCLSTWLFFLIMEMFFFGPEFRIPQLSFRLALPLLAAATFIVFIYLRNKVFKIIFSETEITFFFFLKKSPITYRIQDLLRVKYGHEIPLIGRSLALNRANRFEFSNGEKLVIYPNWATQDDKLNYFDFLKKVGLLTN